MNSVSTTSQVPVPVSSSSSSPIITRTSQQGGNVRQLTAAFNNNIVLRLPGDTPPPRLGERKVADLTAPALTTTPSRPTPSKRKKPTAVKFTQLSPTTVSEVTPNITTTKISHKPELTTTKSQEPEAPEIKVPQEPEVPPTKLSTDPTHLPVVKTVSKINLFFLSLMSLLVVVFSAVAYFFKAQKV